MPPVRISPIEKLRRIWTPGREIEEVVAELEPRTELDSIIRDTLYSILMQHGPQRINLGSDVEPFIISGTLRWEVVHGPGPDSMPELRRREMTIWVENGD
jgi:hypothetical protein